MAAPYSVLPPSPSTLDAPPVCKSFYASYPGLCDSIRRSKGTFCPHQSKCASIGTKQGSRFWKQEKWGGTRGCGMTQQGLLWAAGQPEKIRKVAGIYLVESKYCRGSCNQSPDRIGSASQAMLGKNRGKGREGALRERERPLLRFNSACGFAQPMRQATAGAQAHVPKPDALLHKWGSERLLDKPPARATYKEVWKPLQAAYCHLAPKAQPQLQASLPPLPHRTLRVYRVSSRAA